MKKDEIKKDMLVNVHDNSYCITIVNGKLEHPSEPGGWMQSRNPWKVVAAVDGLPTENDLFEAGIGTEQFNDVMLESKRGEIAFTQAGFCSEVK